MEEERSSIILEGKETGREAADGTKEWKEGKWKEERKRKK